jgi:hypothetical protein
LVFRGRKNNRRFGKEKEARIPGLSFPKFTQSALVVLIVLVLMTRLWLLLAGLALLARLALLLAGLLAGLRLILAARLLIVLARLTALVVRHRLDPPRSCDPQLLLNPLHGPPFRKKAVVPKVSWSHKFSACLIFAPAKSTARKGCEFAPWGSSA